MRRTMESIAAERLHKIGKQNPQLPPGGGGGVRSRHRCHNNHHEHEDEGDDSSDVHHRQAPGVDFTNTLRAVFDAKVT
jgi:hypothetical protein